MESLFMPHKLYSTYIIGSFREINSLGNDNCGYKAVDIYLPVIDIVYYLVSCKKVRFFLVVVGWN